MEAKAFSFTHRTEVFAGGTIREIGDGSGSGKAAGEEDWREKEDQMSKGGEEEQFDE